MSPDRPHGVLVLVVGPSGAGKDAVMRGAHVRIGGDAGIRFARRVVTRSPDGSEDHDTATAEDFAHAAQGGAFLLDWAAHGLRYGIPREVADQMARGEIVVVNGSRTMVNEARRRLGRVLVVLVTAPPSVLRERILARGRDADAAKRLARDGPSAETLEPDLIIDNTGPLDDAVDRLVRFLVVEIEGASSAASRSA